MPRILLDLAHEGETLDEAVADIEQRYGVTVTVVNELGPNGYPEVAVEAESTQRLLAAARDGFELEDDELEELGILYEDE